ncbi:MAG TPA: hypothetical protein PLV92_15080 [Pirellulaceae bacterium]|nr:hypothetical protein [Pirellulaceae bacterium]
MYEKTFKKDWDAVKDELDEYGVKKPAVVKKFGPIEKRVASGIGAAMKTLDKLDPGAVKGVTAKIAKDYATAVQELDVAVTKELSAIEDALEHIKKDDTNYKTNTVFRGLKVFQAKLKEYVANAKARQVEFENELNKVLGEGDKAIKAFKPKCSAVIANAVTAIKKVKLTPSAATYNEEITAVADSLSLTCSTGATVCTWLHDDNKHDRWNDLRRRSAEFKNALSERGSEEEQKSAVAEQLDGFSKIVKEVASVLAGM